VMLAMFKVALPVLSRVMVWPGLVVPTAWLGKVRLLGDRLAMGAELAPGAERLTVWGYRLHCL